VVKETKMSTIEVDQVDSTIQDKTAEKHTHLLFTKKILDLVLMIKKAKQVKVKILEKEGHLIEVKVMKTHKEVLMMAKIICKLNIEWVTESQRSLILKNEKYSHSEFL
jgi:hypothetical protein